VFNNLRWSDPRSVDLPRSVSESSFYRILKAANQLAHRGEVKLKTKTNKVRHFTATKANQVWSWDITYCPSRIIGQHHYLYMIEDIYKQQWVRTLY